jgi:cell division protein FtsW (lipid II flippase)
MRALDEHQDTPAWRPGPFSRGVEGLLLALVSLVALLGFTIVHVTFRLQQAANPWAGLLQAWAPPVALAAWLFILHFLLRWRRVEREQIILPIAGLLMAIGLIMLWRLRPPQAVWGQVTRGLVPGGMAAALLILFPGIVERIRRDWPITVSLVGLGLLLATAFLGVVDEADARLALKIGPLPAIQTSEVVKLSLIVFLAWYIESEGQAAQGRARSVGRFRLPPIGYFVPGTLFVCLATLALVVMSDFGAILILGLMFMALLYAGFEGRIFLTVAAIGLLLSLLVGVALGVFWEVPAVIQQRFTAFADPWSDAPLLVDGQPTGITVAQGPGYQIRQAVYAIQDGGVTGTGLGLGSPEYVPLVHSDMIFAGIAEELGIMGALAVLTCFAILLLRILRVVIMLPAGQVFERLLLVGIAAHLLAQTFVMVGGTVNLLPMTGVTVPFLSQGGMALMVNVVEIGLVLAVAQRVEHGA